MTTHSKAMARGALLSVTLRWFVKGIGLISTIVLARFLTPDDYGVLVMAMLVIGLVEIFFFTAADTALLRHQDAPVDLINSAWTLRMIQAVIVGLTVMALTPVAAHYFRDSRVIPVMLVLASGIIVASVGNIGPVLARKNLEFGLEVKIGISLKLVSFTVTVIAAYVLRSYWALVIGTYAGHLFGIWISYRLHPYRPKWDTSRIRELWNFSQWLLVSSIGNFFGRKLDELILGRVGTARDLGIYNVASEIGQTVTVEISAPVNRTLFPVLSSIQNDRPKSLGLFFSTLGFINTFTIPVGIGMCVLATPFVQVVLGGAWLQVIPVLEVFAIQGVIRFLVSPYYVWFMVINKGKVLAAMSWLELCIFLGFAAALYGHGALGLAWARLLTTLTIVLAWVIVGHFEQLSVVCLMRAVCRPVLAGLGMALALWQLGRMMAFGNPYAELFTLVALGALSYAVVLMLAWLAMGRPVGFERSVLEHVRILRR